MAQANLREHAHDTSLALFSHVAVVEVERLHVATLDRHCECRDARIAKRVVREPQPSECRQTAFLEHRGGQSAHAAVPEEVVAQPEVLEAQLAR